MQAYTQKCHRAHCELSFAERAVAEMKYLSYRALAQFAVCRTIKRKGKKETSEMRVIPANARKTGLKPAGSRRRDAERRYPRNKSPF